MIATELQEETEREAESMPGGSFGGRAFLQPCPVR